MNTLAQLLQQYDSMGLGAPYNTHGDDPWSGDFSRRSDAAAQQGSRMAWANSQLAHANGTQNGGTTNRMPDYFNSGGQPNGSYQPAQYQPPQQFAPQRPMQQPQGNAMTMGGPPANNTIQNYLAQLLGKGVR